MLSAVQRARFVRAWRRGLPGPWDQALGVLALAYRGGLTLRRAVYAMGLRQTGRLPCAVVAVGNLTVGGTGKTPLVELIARRLSARRQRVVVLSRGYRGCAAARPGAVSDGKRILLSAADAGDEPSVLARRLLAPEGGVPVVIGRDRLRSGAWAMARFAPDVLVLDDGFQQLRLRKDLDVVCLDARAPWGPGGLFPRGTLREPREALRRAGLVVLIHAQSGPALARLEAEVSGITTGVPMVRASYVAESIEDLGSGAVRSLEELLRGPVLAFAGIAEPENFESTLRESGVHPVELVPFPDHHRYDRGEREMLEARARGAGAVALVTTEKDAVRFPPGEGLPVWALRVRLELHDPTGAWWAALDRQLAAA